MNVKFRIKKSPVKILDKKTSLLEVKTPNSTLYRFLDRNKYSVVKKDPLAILSILAQVEMLNDEIKAYITKDQGFILNKKVISNTNILELLRRVEN